MTEDTKWPAQLLKSHRDRAYASAPKTPQLFRAERDRVGHSSIWSSRCPIRCQPSGSPFEGYEAGSILSFLWLAFREGHLPSRPFVSSLIYVPRSLVLSLSPLPSLLLPATASIPCSFLFHFFFSFNLPALSVRRGTAPFCSWSPRASTSAESFTAIPIDRTGNDTVINANDL